MNRTLKKVLATAALVAFAAGAQAQETVVWWDFLGGGDGIRMKKLLEDFNAEHKDTIEVQATTLDWGVPFYTKVQTSAAVGEGPDMMTYHTSRIPLAVDQGTLSEITADDMKTMGLSESTFAAATWDAVQVNGKQYAVPFDTHPIVLYYNKDKLAAAEEVPPDDGFLGLNSASKRNQRCRCECFQQDAIHSVSSTYPIHGTRFASFSQPGQSSEPSCWRSI